MAKRTKKKAKVSEEYTWSSGLRVNTGRGVCLNADPGVETFLAVVERIQGKDEDGICRPEDIIEASRSSRSATHKMFEWDDTVAGERYRLEQARLALRCVVVHYAEKGGEVRQVRALSKIKRDDGSNGFAKTMAAMIRPTDREYILNGALMGLRQWRKRWSELNAVAEAATALKHIDTGIEKLRAAVANA